jgi:hypothetical protein
MFTKRLIPVIMYREVLTFVDRFTGTGALPAARLI